MQLEGTELVDHEAEPLVLFQQLARLPPRRQIQLVPRRDRIVVRSEKLWRRVVTEQLQHRRASWPRAREHPVAPRRHALLLLLVRPHRTALVRALAWDVLERGREQDVPLAKSAEGLLGLDGSAQLVVREKRAQVELGDVLQGDRTRQVHAVVEVAEPEEMLEAVGEVERRDRCQLLADLQVAVDLEHLRVPSRELLLVRSEVRR
mmetsp:Transcript_29725/g.69384  ORF Transcript_29725/g.69384 Transcript_29725/m.69384 type:complete len:205 (+) Transcript_29725:639-1253(+)